DAYQLLRGVGNLCVGAEDNPRYDARRLVDLLIAGLRVHLPNTGRNGNGYCAGAPGLEIVSHQQQTGDSVNISTLACILPPDLILRIAQDASPERRLALLQTLELDHSFRQFRAEAAARQALRPLAGIAPPGGTPSRMIYDQDHSTAPDPA